MTTTEATVWWAFDWSADDSLLSLLSSAEHTRMRSYHRPGDRRRFAIGAALVRMAAAATGAGPAGEVMVDRTCARCGAGHGPPRIVGSAVRFSLSHSADAVALAFSDRPVGIDVEKISEIDLTLMQPEVLAPDEPAPTDTAGFFTYWTRKESYLKARGIGLAVDMTTFAVTSPRQPPAILRHHGRGPVTMRDLHPPAGYAAALTVLCDDELIVTEGDAAAPDSPVRS